MRALSLQCPFYSGAAPGGLALKPCRSSKFNRCEIAFWCCALNFSLKSIVMLTTCNKSWFSDCYTVIVRALHQGGCVQSNAVKWDE